MFGVMRKFDAATPTDIEVDNIIIKGVVYETDGITPAPNVTVAVRNETAGINYGVKSTNSAGEYDVRVFKGFNVIIAKTGDKISFTVNGIKERIYVLGTKDLVPPYIVNVDVVRKNNREVWKLPTWAWVAIASGAMLLLMGEK